MQLAISDASLCRCWLPLYLRGPLLFPGLYIPGEVLWGQDDIKGGQDDTNIIMNPWPSRPRLRLFFICRCVVVLCKMSTFVNICQYFCQHFRWSLCKDGYFQKKYVNICQYFFKFFLERRWCVAFIYHHSFFTAEYLGNIDNVDTLIYWHASCKAGNCIWGISIYSSESIDTVNTQCYISIQPFQILLEPGRAELLTWLTVYYEIRFTCSGFSNVSSEFSWKFVIV